MRSSKAVIIFLCCFIQASVCNAQKDKLHVDSTGKITASTSSRLKDTSAKKYNPGIAIKRSAMLPGWGQYTNKKYWKIPIVYGALGSSGYFFFHNLKQYKEAKQALDYATDSDPSNDNLIKEPYYSVRMQPERIRTFRNSVRQNVDYSALFFIIFWGLNVADAAVDAHLKTFDVSDDLSLSFKAGFSPLAKTNGVSVLLTIR